MVDVSYQISKEDYEKAKKEGVKSLLSEAVICGYGFYGGKVTEVEGKYYLSYTRGDSCD